MEALETKVRAWVMADSKSAETPEIEYHCETRDRFDVRLAAMAVVLVHKNIIGEEVA